MSTKIKIDGNECEIEYEGQSALFGVSVIALVENNTYTKRFYVPTEWVYNTSLKFAVVSGHVFEKLSIGHQTLKLIGATPWWRN